jgi:hypothetical protein
LRFSLERATISRMKPLLVWMGSMWLWFCGILGSYTVGRWIDGHDEGLMALAGLVGGLFLYPWCAQENTKMDKEAGRKEEALRASIEADFRSGPAS